MKFHVLFIFCVAMSPTIAFIAELQTIIPSATLAFKFVGTGIKAVKGVAGQKLVCYECTNNDENGACAQGGAAQQCEMRSLLRRFGGYLKTKFIGRPNVVPVCLRAEIQVGQNLVTRHSCAMVNENDSLDDQATCTSSLYMLGGVSGEVESCEMCATNRCNTHKRSTSRPRQAWEPYVQPSALVRSMELGHVQHDGQHIDIKSNASPLVASISLLISTVFLFCVY
ncbi:hypothetical protein B566_EDAN013094 [Ephemera danica]|nr:hypothetical protein B566_EDAN013094 [Ephemera danica]